MKLRILSDIHLEFGDIEITKLPDDKDTVLVLAGDIGVGMSALPFIKDMCDRFAKVLYVLGNHEFYGHYVHLIRDNWMVVATTIPNLIVLDNGAVTIDDVVFIGGTMWTDVNNDCWFAKQNLKRYMHEFSGTIKGWSVDQSIQAHKETKRFFASVMADSVGDKIVCITHHLPHEVCIKEPFIGNVINPGFASTDLERDRKSVV